MHFSDNTGAPIAETRSQARAFVVTSILGMILVPVSVALARLLSVDLLSLLRPGIYLFFVGLAATAPLIILLVWFMRTLWRPLAELRRSQIEFLSQLGFDLTPARIVLLSLIAGASEELLFRGVFQTVIDRYASVALAIILPNVLFGALHARTLFYAFAAALAGAYFGLLFWVTESLITPVVAHTIYDVVALEWARREINNLKRPDQSGRAKSSGSSVTG